MKTLKKKSDFVKLFNIKNSVIAIILVAFIIAGITFVVYFNNSFKPFYKEQQAVIHKKSVENIIAVEYNIWQNNSYILNDIDIACVINETDYDSESRYRAIRNAKNSMSIFGFKTLDIISEQRRKIWNSENMISVDLNTYFQENKDFCDYYNRFLDGENFFVSLQENSVTYFNKDYRGFVVVVSLYYDEFVNKISDTGNPLVVYYKNNNPILAESAIDEKLFYERISDEDIEGEFLFKNKLCVYTRYRDALCVSSIEYVSVIMDAFRRAPFVWILVISLLLFLGAVAYVGFKYMQTLILGYIKEISTADKVLKYSKAELYTIKLFVATEDTPEYSEELVKIFENNGYAFYTALLFIIDDLSCVNNKKNNLCYDISNVIKNVFSAEGYCLCVSISSDKIGVIYSTDNPQLIKEYHEKLNKILKEEYNTTVTLVKSKDEEEYQKLYSHISKINNLADYRFISGAESFIEEEKVPVSASEVDYPIDIQKKILEMCKLEKWDNVMDYLTDFIDYIAKNDYTVAQSWSLMLFMNVIRNLDLPSKNADFKIIRNITQYDTFYESAIRFINYLKENEKDTSKLMSEDSFVKKIKNLTDENYSNPAYDLNMLSELLQNTSEHVSRKFKKLTNENFSQYLLNYRLEKAKEFLCDSNLKVSDIAEKCGFNSAAYFTTVFKKKLSVSPNEYRAKNKNK